MPYPINDGQAPGSVSDLLERLDSVAEILPRRLKQCADFTRRNLHLIAVSTVSEMAQGCDVAPSVYMRFCQALGFSGYTEMQGLFRARFTDFRPAYETRIDNLRGDGEVEAGRLLAEFAEAGHKSLLSLANSVTSESMERIAEGLAAARVVHLVGLRRSFSVVSNMSYLLDKLGVPANLHYGAGMLNTARSILPGDALFAVSFAPFSEETIRLAEDCVRRDIPVFGLTDTENSPLEAFTRYLLIAREDEVGGFRGVSAAITLTTSLAVAIKVRQTQES